MSRVTIAGLKEEVAHVREARTRWHQQYLDLEKMVKHQEEKIAELEGSNGRAEAYREVFEKLLEKVLER